MNRAVTGIYHHNLLLDFMREDFSHGFTLIDPTGELASLAARITPAEAFLFEPADQKHCAGFNVFDGVKPDDRQTFVEDFCTYFDNMYPEGANTLARANSNYILALSLRILLDTPGTSLLGLLKVLTDKPYRTQCMSFCLDPVVLAGWTYIDGMEDKKWWPNAVAPLLSKIGKLLMSPRLRNIVGQEHSTFSVTKGKVTLANLDRSVIGDLTAKLLGGLLISRAEGPLYIIDPGFFGDVRLRGNTTVAFHFLNELSPALQSTVTTSELFIFKTTKRDAEELAFHVNLNNPRVLTELAHNKYQTADGEYSVPIVNLPRKLKALRKLARGFYTRPRATVEKKIARFWEGKNDRYSSRPR